MNSFHAFLFVAAVAISYIAVFTDKEQNAN